MLPPNSDYHDSLLASSINLQQVYSQGNYTVMSNQPNHVKNIILPSYHSLWLGRISYNIGPANTNLYS